MKPGQILQFCDTQGIQFVDLKFCDPPGLRQHFPIKLSELRDDCWEVGIGFDGSSVCGFQAIEESDVLLMPDASTAIIDPVCKIPTLSITCEFCDPISKRPFSFSFEKEARY